MKDPTQQTNVVPTDSPSIYAALSSTAKLALVLPNGNPPAGIAGFLFDVPEEQTFVLDSDITDHFVEDNTAIQDQVALRPEKVTLRGLVAEITFNDLGLSEIPSQLPPPRRLPLNFPLMPLISDGAMQLAGIDVGMIQTRANFVLNGPLSPVLTGKVSALSAGGLAGLTGTVLSFAPGLSPELSFIQSDLSDMAADQIDQLNLTMIGALADGAQPSPQPAPNLKTYYDGQIGSNPALTKQAAALGLFYQLWKGRVLFTVQTVWGILESMAIEHAQVVQDADDAYRSKLEVTFKKMRIAGDLIVASPTTIAGRAYAQTIAGSPQGLGTAGLSPVTPFQSSLLLAQL